MKKRAALTGLQKTIVYLCLLLINYAINVVSYLNLINVCEYIARRIEMRKLGKVVDPFESIYREIAIMKKLNHKNIVQLIEVLYIHMIRPYIATVYIVMIV